MPEIVTTRRGFLTGRSVKARPIYHPPGVTDRSIQDCSGCGDCASACPTGIIAMQNGRPTLDFDAGECTFCGECANHCLEPVFPAVRATQFAHHAVIATSCLALNYVDCMACRDACPTSAIRFKPRLGGPFVPSLEADPCTGCGACVSVCPTQAITMTARTTETVHA